MAFNSPLPIQRLDAFCPFRRRDGDGKGNLPCPFKEGHLRYPIGFQYGPSRSLSFFFKEDPGDFEGIKIQPLKIPILNHWTIKPLRREEVKDFLSQEISRPVYWVRCIEKLLQEGFTQFIEVGHEATLTKLMRWINREAEAFSAGDRLPH